jgi:hypothetical protein
MKIAVLRLGAVALLGACGDSSVGTEPWEPGQPGCQDDYVLRSVGETWSNPSDCTVCECAPDNQIECTLDPWPIPECPPVDDCPATTPVCVGGEWRCADTCPPCTGLEPEPCPPPAPGGCSDGGEPRCVEEGSVDRWRCEPHYCSCPGTPEPCGVGPTGCPQYTSCGPDGWECTSICSGLACETQFPEGRASAVALAFEPCGCMVDSPCVAVCGARCVTGDAPSSECEDCVVEQLVYGAACAVPLFSYCTDQCSLYTLCVSLAP